MASQPSSRKTFIHSSINISRSYNSHGLDIYWEFPATATDMANFGTLLAEWRAAVTNESKTFGKPLLLLVAAVYYSATYNSLLHPIQSIKTTWTGSMSYSFFAPGCSPNVTGTPASLTPCFLVQSNQSYHGDSGITAWLQAGMPPKKIAFGLPFYGNAWNLTDPNQHGIFATAEGMAVPPDGSANYNLIKAYIAEKGAPTVFNSTLVMDYSYTGKTWIGYDDTQSITTKVSYAKGKGPVGYFAWNVGIDVTWTLSQAASCAWGAY
ncbi:hypothetical protein ACE6H2_025658 [Prunus campanulata]